MQGSLSLRNGVLYVGRHATTAHVRPYDLDGRPLGAGFSFRAPDGGRSEASGLDVDDEHTVWIADNAAGRVRGFTLFGSEVRGFGAGGGSGRERDVPGSTAHVVDVVATGEGDDEEPALLVACEGPRRHGVQVFDPDGTWTASLRSEGSPLKSFRDVLRLAHGGRMTYVCEAGGGGRVQVFRDGDFHFLFQVRDATGTPLEPRAVAPLDDGRLVVATGGARSSLLLLDASGRTLAVLADEGGGEGGTVFEPEDVVVEPGTLETRRRLAVLDCDGDRVQVFTLQGHCYGSIRSLPGAS